MGVVLIERLIYPLCIVLCRSRSRHLLSLDRDLALRELAREGALLGGGSGLLGALVDELVELLGLLLGLGGAGNNDGSHAGLAGEAGGGDEALHLGGLGAGLLALLGESAAHDELGDVVLLGKVEELADLVGTLGATAALTDDVGEALDLVVALLDDDGEDDGEVRGDDATTDGLAAALTSGLGAVARLAGLEEETDAAGSEDTLLHGETLLVVSTGDLEDVALPGIAEDVGLNLVGHALVHEGTAVVVEKVR